MQRRPGFQRFFRELRRRRVSGIALLYIIGAYAVLQFADTILVSSFGLPDWILPMLVLVAAAGFPIALVVAWAVKWTAEGPRTDEGQRFNDLVTGGGRVAVVVVVALASAGMGVSGWQLWGLRDGGAGLVEDEPGLDPKRIAVLYFDDHSPDGELGYLADALTEAVIHELGQVSALELISRNGVKRYREGDGGPAEVASELGVGSIVEGSVSRTPGGIRVTFQLIRGDDLSHLHSGTIDAPEGEWLALREELVQEVARALRRRLGAVVELERRQRGNRSDEAWDLVSRAARLRTDFRSLRRDDAAAGLRLLDRADSLLTVAEQLDPQWVEPLLLRGWIARHYALARGPVAGTPDSAWSARALAHADRAVAMESDRARALELRGVLRFESARRAGSQAKRTLLERAEEDLRQAVGEDERRVHAWWALSELLVEQSRYEEARLAARHALDADEFLQIEAGALWAIAYSAMQFGPEDDVIRYCGEGRERFPEESNFMICRFFILASFPQVEPDVEAAVRLADSLVAVVGSGNRADFRAYASMQVAKVAARAGQRDSAAALIRQATGGGPTPAWLSYDEAHARLLLGDTARAISLLRTALAAQVVDSAAVARDWWWEPLRPDPRFRAALGPFAPPSP